MAVALSLVGTGCSAFAHASPPAQATPSPAGAPRLGVGAAARAPYTDAAAAAAYLQHWYNGRSYRSSHWWQSAIALSVVTTYMQASGSRAYVSDLADTYLAFHNTMDFTRNYYDDEGWWVLTWAQAYRLTGERQYLREAEHIFADMASGWGPACGGGLVWSKTQPYKNAITNELFLDAAATLHNLIPGDRRYARWALREWRWFKGTGMLTRRYLVVDGLSSCKPDLRSVAWTYNQGVLIGALVQLSQMTRRRALLATAERVAYAVISSPKLSPRGILQEPCEPTSCDSDSRIFKAVLAQNLGILQDAAPSALYQEYLGRNAQAVWNLDRRGNAFGLRWAGPFADGGSGQQVAALAILTTQIPAPGA